MVYCASELIENSKLFYKSNSFSSVLPTSQVGYHVSKPIESVVYCFSTLHADKIHTDTKSQSLCMHYAFQSTPRLISHQNGWSFNSCPGTTTGVNSCWGDSHRRDILRWYQVIKYRAMRGNQSELPLVRNLPRCHVNTPSVS